MLDNIAITLIGAKGVGKSSLIQRLKGRAFDVTSQATVGISYESLELKNKKFNIWDTSGDSRFKQLILNLTSNSAIVILVFSVDDTASFQQMPRLLAAVKESNPGATYWLVGNKTDLARAVNREDAESFATENGLIYKETSAQTDEIKEEIGSDLLAYRSTLNSSALDNLNKKITQFQNNYPDNKEIIKICEILLSGLARPEMNRTDHFKSEEKNLKKYFNTLQMTMFSLLNSVLNILTIAALALSIIGLFLTYCCGVLEKNKQTSGHRLMFWSFGEKQQAQITCHQVFKYPDSGDLPLSASL